MLSLTVKEVCDWLEQTYGGSVWLKNKNRPPQNKACYTWSLSTKEAEHFLKELLPYLKIKKENAQVALDLCKTISRRNRRSNMSKELIQFRYDCYMRLKQLNSRGVPLH